jgi:ubiquinone/menaquinone biosynthesis C-methylase UbiE
MNAKLTIVVAVLAAMVSLAAQQPPASQRQPQRRGHIFSPQDLGLLEPPDREAWQKPDQVMDALQIAEGSVVADLGAGGGWFTIRLARRVGAYGTVYAEDVQRLMIEAIERRVTREGLTNVRTILGEYDDPFPRLPPNTLDAVLIVDAFHEMEHPVVLLRNVARALKPTGLIGILDYRPGEGGPGPDPEDRVPPSIIIQAATAAGLKLAGQEEFLRYQYFLRFTR